MISTNINILDIVEIPQEDIDLIKLAAREDTELKLQGILGEDFSILDYDLEFEFFCNVKIKPKIK
jgi:hypothetical protein